MRSESGRYTAEHMVTLISECRLFKAFNPARLINLRENLELVFLHAGDTLYAEGDSIDSFYLLIEGELIEKRESESDERRYKSSDFESNPVIGARQLLAEGNRPTTVTAAVPSELVKFPKDVFMHSSLMEGRDPDLLRRDIMKRLLESELLKVLPTIFGPLDPGTFRDLTECLEWVHVSRGHHIFDQNEEADSFYVLMSGRLQVLVPEHDDAEAQPVDEIGPGATVGEMEVITGEKRSNTVIASRDSELVRFSREQFDELTDRFPGLWRRITTVMVHRLRDAYRGMKKKALSSNVLIAPASDGLLLGEFTVRLQKMLRTSVAPQGNTLVLTSSEVDRKLGRPGIAQSKEGERNELRLRVWLSEQEKKHAVVLLVTDAELTEWTARCIRNADEVMFVAQAAAKPETGLIAREVRNRELAHQADRRRSLVLLHEADVDRPSGTKAWLEEFGLLNPAGNPRSPGRHFHVRRNHEGDYQRIGRFITRSEVGLVLSGGGARGFAHVGCIRAMQERDMPIDVIGGVSMGSLVSAAYAYDPDNFEQTIEHVKSQLPGVLSDLTPPVVSIARGRRFDQRLKGWFGDVQIEDLWLPYFCVTSNLTLANIFVHDSGPLWWAVRASGTLPGITTPVVHNHQLFFDGCLLDNLPMDVMRERMYESYVIAVDVVPPHDLEVSATDSLQSPSGWWLLWDRLNPFSKTYDLPNIFSILQRAGELGSVYGRQRLIDGEYADLYIQPSVGDIHIADFKQVDRSAKIGFDECGEKLSEWWETVRPPAN